MSRPRRPLRSRIWYYRPFSYLSWKPVSIGGDEFNWHTLVIGTPLTGQLVFATGECDGLGDCAWYAEECPEAYAYRWPFDLLGHNAQGPCDKQDCYCQEEAHE